MSPAPMVSTRSPSCKQSLKDAEQAHRGFRRTQARRRRAFAWRVPWHVRPHRQSALLQPHRRRARPAHRQPTRRREVVHQIARSGIAVWLEHQYHASLRPSGLRRGQGRSDLGRVMAVVVDQQDLAGPGLNFAEVLEASIDAFKFLKRPHYRCRRRSAVRQQRRLPPANSSRCACPADAASHAGAGDALRITEVLLHLARANTSNSSCSLEPILTARISASSFVP